MHTKEIFACFFFLLDINLCDRFVMRIISNENLLKSYNMNNFFFFCFTNLTKLLCSLKKKKENYLLKIKNLSINH